MRFSLLIAAAPLVLLAACATVAPPQGAQAVNPAPAGETPYGMFLAGRGALNDGKSAEAAQYFDRARQASDPDPLIADQAFIAALLSGDVSKAAAIAPTSEDAAEGGKRLGKFVVAVEALAQGKGKQAQILLSRDAIAFPHRPAAALLAPWAAAQAGDVAASLVRPEVRGDQLVEYFGRIGQAFLFERAKRYDEAETDFKAAANGANASEMAILAYGGFLERRGRRIDAVALYGAAQVNDPNDSAIIAASRRATAGQPAPPLPTLREGAAQVLLAPAAGMMEAKQTQLALAYLRLALRLDPQRDEAWVLVGDIMQGSGDTEAAREAYGHPKPGSIEYGAAQAKLAWTYQAADDKATALKLARGAAASGDIGARITLADLLRADEQYAESISVLSGLIAEAKRPDWRLIYARGVAYGQMDRWPEAEADLQAALTLQPDEPELLNYLGYSWIDRGQHLPEAMAMVEKAVGANPRSGAMVDSLGWAYYRLGQYKKAVDKLEEAVELEAGDPEINNHLGDAYWKAGRRDEAVFQWRRVLTLNPDAKIKAATEAKLSSGLGPDGGAPPKIAGK